jgi:8-amino-3,8-dideoxy-alpha-D-manno-octulosonate transaminase
MVPLGASQIGRLEQQAVVDVLEDGVLYRYDGSRVAEFERRLAEWLGGSPSVLAVNSGSSALLLAFAALGLDPGFEVILPTVGYVTAATAIRAAGGVPRFVSVDRSLSVDVARAEALVTERTRAALIVHPYGAAGDLDGMAQLARRRGLALIEDACQAAGATYRRAPLGTIGEAAAFSFQYFKLVTTGEGGAFVTADPALHARASLMHDAALIWTSPALARRADSVTLPPLNFRMSEIDGALGCVQLARVADLMPRLRSLHAMLRERASGHPGVTLRPSHDEDGDSGTHLIFYLRDRSEAGRVVDQLRGHGINAGLVLSGRGQNRHWAGDWGPALAASGIAQPPMDVLERDRSTLGAGVVLPIDPRYRSIHLDAAGEALEQALGRCK